MDFKKILFTQIKSHFSKANLNVDTLTIYFDLITNSELISILKDNKSLLHSEFEVKDYNSIKNLFVLKITKEYKKVNPDVNIVGILVIIYLEKNDYSIYLYDNDKKKDAILFNFKL